MATWQSPDYTVATVLEDADVERITVPQDQFDFDGFSRKILTFNKSVMSKRVHSPFAVVTVDKPGGTPEWGPEKGRMTFLDDLQHGKLLFFPFTDTNVGDPIPCADGKKRSIDEGSDFAMGDVDCVGFLVGLSKSNYTIDAAIHAGGACPGPAPSVDVRNCGVFDEPMDAFIRRFIRK
jgi:hypothetical protein